MLFYGWKSDGVKCRVHSGPCTFLWVPRVEQLEMLPLDVERKTNLLDRVVSVSALVEVEASIAGTPINPSSQQVNLFDSEVQ